MRGAGPWRHIDATLEDFDGRVAFDLAVAGINTRTMNPLRKSGLKRLQAQWRRVAAVTGQHISPLLPEEMIYNSQLPCLAVEAMRTLTRTPPFTYVHYLQRLLFAEGVNINDIEVLRDACEELSADSDLLVGLMGRERVMERTRRQILAARSYGTSVLPSVLVSDDGAKFRLFAGGFTDATQLGADIQTWLAE